MMFENLLERLTIEFKTEGPTFIQTGRDQAGRVLMIQAMAAGMAMELPGAYNESIAGKVGIESV